MDCSYLILLEEYPRTDLESRRARLGMLKIGVKKFSGADSRSVERALERPKIQMSECVLPESRVRCSPTRAHCVLRTRLAVVDRWRGGEGQIFTFVNACNCGRKH